MGHGYNARMQNPHQESSGWPWQTLGTRLLTAMAEPRVARSVNAAAIILLAGAAAQWTWGLMAPAHHHAQPSRIASRAVAPRLSSLLQAHVFGRASATDLAAIPVSHLALTLTGLVLGAHPLALIGSAGKVRPYGIGSLVSPGVRLAAVTPTRAIVRRNGRLQSLLLYPPRLDERAPAAPQAPSPAAGAAGAKAPPASPARAQAPGASRRAAVTVSVTPAALGGLSRIPTARWRQWLTSGPTGGVLVKAGPPQSLSVLHLKAGDVIEEINGNPVNSLGAALSAYMAGAKTGGVTLDVARHGHMQVFHYVLSGR